MTDGLAQERAIPLREFIYHIYHRRLHALAAFGIVFGLGLLIAAQITPSYRATATLVVLPSPEYTVRAAAGSHDANASALALDQIMKTETEILGSDDLHAAALRKLGPPTVYPDIFSPPSRGLLRRGVHAIAAVLLAPWRAPPQDELAARNERGLRRFRTDLAVLPAKDANVITVTFDGREGRQAADTVNTLLGLYAARRSRLYDDPQLELVRREAEAASRAASVADRQLADFKRTRGISDYDQERSLLLQRRSQASQRVSEALAATSEYRARLISIGGQLKIEPATIGVFEEDDPDTRLQAVNSGLQDLRAKLAAARDKYKDTSRMVAALQVQISSHEAEAARLSRNTASSVVRRGRNPSLDPLHLDYARASAELAAAQARLASERLDAAEVSAAIAAQDADEAALAALQRQKASAEQEYKDASRIFVERRLSEAEDARRLSNVRVIQPALIPQAPRPLPMLVIVAGLVLGVLSSFAWLAVTFVLRPVFLTGEGLQAATGLPVLGVFVREPAPADEDLLVI